MELRGGCSRQASYPGESCEQPGLQTSRRSGWPGRNRRQDFVAATTTYMFPFAHHPSRDGSNNECPSRSPVRRLRRGPVEARAQDTRSNIQLPPCTFAAVPMAFWRMKVESNKILVS